MEHIPYINVVNKKESIYEESVDTIVSDLYPDIHKVLGVSAEAYVSDITVQNDRVLISGEVQCEVCFLGEENENILKMKTNLRFARMEDINASLGMVYAEAKVCQATCKVINPRKISIITNIAVNTSLYQKEVLHSPQMEEFETLTSNVRVNLMESINQNEFTISENVPFKLDAYDEYEVFGITPIVTVNDLKVLRNKLMLRGNIEFNGYYLLDHTMGKMSGNLPFSQILDVNLEEEMLENDMKLTITKMEYEHTFDNEYYFTVGLKSLFSQYKKHDVTMVHDIYSKTHELTTTKEENQIFAFCDKKIEIMEFHTVLKTDHTIDNILYSNAYVMQEKKDDGTYHTYANLSAVYQAEGTHYTYEEKYPILENKKMHVQEIKTQVVSPSEIKMIAKVCNEPMEMIHQEIYKDVEIGEEKVVEADCMILKYIAGAMNIWDLAKKYHTTQQAIKDANNLEENIVENQMIIIPR